MTGSVSFTLINLQGGESFSAVESEPMDKSYTIHPASAEETNEGWVWFKQPDLPTRTIIKVQNVNTGRFVFCESRRIDHNFLHNYKETSKKELEDPEDCLFISEWYRNALGGFDPTRHTGNKVLLRVTPLKRWRWFWYSLRSSSHHPDLVARLGTRLGVLGSWLGLVGVSPIILELTDLEKCGKLVILVVIAIVSGVVGGCACRGVRR